MESFTSLSGVLYKLKKGIFGSKWSKKYVEFDGITLKQYTTDKASKQSKSFDISKCKLLQYDEREFSFTIVDERNDTKSITLSAENEIDYNLWAHELIEAKKNLSELNEIDVYQLNYGMETEDVHVLVPTVEGDYIGQFFRLYDLTDHDDDPVIDVNLLSNLILGLDDHMSINCGKYIARDVNNERIQLISLSAFMKWWISYKSEMLKQQNNENQITQMQYRLSDSIFFTGLFSSHMLEHHVNIAKLLKIRVPSLTQIVSEWELVHTSEDWNKTYQEIINEILNVEEAAGFKHDIDVESMQVQTKIEGFQTMRITSAISFYKFLSDFSTTAIKCTEIIVDEYSLPDELKTIKKDEDCNEEEIYTYDNLIFRISAVPGEKQDATPSVERQSELLTDDTHNRKFAGLAFNSTQLLQKIVFDLQEEQLERLVLNNITTGDRPPRYHVDLMATIDYCGYRIEIHTPSREDAGILVHGKNDDTGTNVSDSEITHKLLQKIANKMKMEIFKRDVSITSFAKKSAAFICPNLKVYKYRTSSDFYFTHTDVLLPQDLLQSSATNNSVDAIELDTRKLRPELLNYLPSSATVTSHICREDAQDQDEIDQIAKSVESLHYLYTQHIPETSSLLDNMSYMVLDSYGITKFLHDRGINCRMMGILYSLTKISIVKKALLCECVARTCKCILFSALRQCARRGKAESIIALINEQSEAEDFIESQVVILADKKKIVLDFFNLVLGNGTEPKEFWNEILSNEVFKKFNIDLRSILAYDPDKASLHVPQLFMALQYHTGVICTNYQTLASNFEKLDISDPLTSSDFKTYFTADCKMPMVCPGPCGKIAAAGEALLGCELYEDAIYSFRLRISSLTLAGNYVNSPKFTTNLGHSIYLLALSHYLNGQYVEAIDTLKLYMGTYDNDSPLLSRMLTLLMSIKFSMGKVDDAMKLFEQALDMYTFSLGSNHPIICVHFCTLADLYFKAGAYSQSKVMILLALETSHRILGEEHIVTSAYRTKVASLYLKEEKFKQAETALATNSIICNNFLSKKVQFLNETIEIYFGLASAYVKNGNKDEALKLLLKVKEMCKSNEDKVDHDLYLSTILLLSDIYNSNVQPTESQKQLEDAWVILQQNNLKTSSSAFVKITCQMLSSYFSTLDLQVRLLLETVEKEVNADIMPFINSKVWDAVCHIVISALWTNKPHEFVETIITKYHSFDVMNDDSKKALLNAESLPSDSGISLALQIAIISKLIKYSNMWQSSNRTNF